jgi:F-type H+-transporting ATPase subunit delta
MQVSKMVRNYSEAIMHASGKHVIENIRELDNLNRLIMELQKQYNKHLFNDAVGQRKIVSIFCSMGFSELAINLLKKLIKKHSLSMLQDICQYLPALVDQKLGVYLAEVKSVTPLKQKEKEDIQTYLQTHLNKNFNIKNIIDESILGGVKVIFDSFLLDASIACKLQKAHKHLSEYQIRI